jgi:hypothetical protein
MNYATYRKTAAVAVIAATLSYGCTTERVIERPVPVKVPSLCLTACPYPERVPQTNGELAEDWRARGEALVCYSSRLECVRELVAP